MPDEIVASCGRIQCVFGAQQSPAWFVQLLHVDNAFMLVAMQEPDRSEETLYLERLPDDDQIEVETRPLDIPGRFYYRVIVPIELRKAPDLLAPVISRHVFKNAEEIIECNRLYRCPQSSVTFCKLAYEDGWLFETLNSGIKVLERLESEPVVEYGQFFYVVRIPVGIRVAPHIMAQRAGKGYKLHSVVEASQRFTPPGSKITYVRVCKEKGMRCACSHSHRHRQDKSTAAEAGAGSPSSAADAPPPLSDEQQPASPTVHTSSCHGGWIFETTMDGQVVLEPIAKPALRQVERLFYRVLEDVEVLPTPSFAAMSGNAAALVGSEQHEAVGTRRGSSKKALVAAPVSPLAKRKRMQGTLIECSERLVPRVASLGPDGDQVPEMAFIKLRHDVGWICERSTQPPFRLVLEQVQGFAVTRDLPKFYRVLVPLNLRSAPDYECPRLPGVTPMAVGTVFESSLQYTPPGSKITYIKVASDAHPSGSSGSASGWLFDQTPTGDRVLEAVDEDPEKKNGRFFYRVVCEKKEVLLSPERTSEVVRYLFANTIFAAEMEYTLPRTQDTYVRLTKEKGWVMLDPRKPTRTASTASISEHETEYEDEAEHPHRTLVRISEELYNLYCMPPSWVSIGFPNRTWFKVPDEFCRTVLAEETMLQMEIFEPRNVLAASSQGRDNVPISRRGSVKLQGGEIVWKCVLDEIKHSASALLFTFPWKQVWWIFEIDGEPERHALELQHGLRGGYRAVFFDGEQLLQNRSVSDMLWDAGSEFSFTWHEHTFKVVITLEGAFFSQYLQFYSYALLVDEEEITPVEF